MKVKGTVRIKEMLAFNVRKYRLLKGMSVYEVSDLCGVADTYIRNIENGEQNIPMRFVETLSTVFNIKAKQLFQ